ncbi:PEP-CTERM sorting domain-containing protein [Oscillatoria laete-virens NRMC-F 0139]|nr:PEP-CTERM sorting domain-containing protein [Oscillatoria laete-virens]MDL5055775.1 PEP-CTERM sorting domain-containing protein [Oscillatoria laete-virens NRMC-F 0139]
MTKFITNFLPVFLGLLMAPLTLAQTTIINFDTPGNWTAGSGAITGYQTDHTYTQGGWLFTGGPALRNTTSDVNGVPGALGVNAWRLRDDSAVTWTGTYTLALGAGQYFSNFGFDSRRWDDAPNPSYFVQYSFNGGVDFTTVTFGSSGVLNNAAYDNSNNWKTFSEVIASATALPANQFVVKFQSTNTTERIMIDNFQFTVSAIPEPSTCALMGLGIGAFLLLARCKLRGKLPA